MFLKILGDNEKIISDAVNAMQNEIVTNIDCKKSSGKVTRVENLIKLIRDTNSSFYSIIRRLVIEFCSFKVQLCSSRKVQIISLWKFFGSK